MSDNSYMFVDEDKEDISTAGGVEPKGKHVDEAVTGDIEDNSTINLVADEELSPKLTFQQKLEKRADELQKRIDDLEAGESASSRLDSFRNDSSDRFESIKDGVRNKTGAEEEPSAVALSTDKMATDGKGFGIASLVFGVIAMTLFCSFFNIVASVMSLIFGIIQIKRGGGKGLAITGIVLSILSVILLIVCMSLVMSNQAFVDMLSGGMLTDMLSITQTLQ